LINVVTIAIVEGQLRWREINTITIVAFIDINSLSRDTYIKDHSESHLVPVALDLSTRKVVWLLSVYCCFALYC